MQLDVPADTARDEQGNLFTGDLSVSEVPAALAPVALPDDFAPSMLITIQPVGVTFDQPVPLTFPNSDGLDADSEVDIFSIDPNTGAFVVVGTGQVSPNGSEIVTISGGVMEASWHFMLPPGTAQNSAMNNGENEDPCQCELQEAGSAVHLHAGNLTEDHATVSYRSFNRDRSLRFIYNSTTADPQPIIATETTIPLESAVPDTSSTRLFVGGALVSEELHTDTSSLSESQDETIRQAAQFDAKDLATGSYAYNLAITNHFGSAGRTTQQGGRLFVNNEIDSPFGAGWTLEGLQRLHIEPTGAVSITEGHGSILRFGFGVSAGGLVESFNHTDAVRPSVFVVEDFDGDNNLDMMVAEGETGNLVLFLGDGAGGFPTVRNTPSGLPYSPTSGPDPVSIDSADFNGDGSPDIVVTLARDSQLRIYLNDGAGFFTLSEDRSVLSWPSALVAGEFTGDGNQDVVLTWSFRSQFQLIAGNGDGTLSALAAKPLGNNAISAAVGDLDGNGHLDFVVMRVSQNRLDLRFNNGVGGFSNASRTAGLIGPFGNRKSIAVADFNGDGNLDIVHTNSPANQVSFHLSDGPGSWQPRIAYNVGTLPRGLDIADFDGDGNIDVAISNSGNGSIQILSGDGSGGFIVAPEIVITGTASMENLHAADFDGNGTPDIAVTRGSGTSGNVIVLLNNPVTYESPAGDFSTLVQNPDGSFTRRLKNGTTIDFDTAGLMTAVTDRNGNATTYGYDANDNLTTITDPAGLQTTLAYDGAGKLSSVTDPAFRVTGFTVDALGDLVTITDPDLSARHFAYDPRHRLTTQTSKRGFDNTYQYGFHGRATRVDRADLTSNLFAAAEVVGLIDGSAAGGTLGTPANPALLTRPDAVKAIYTDGRGKVTTYGVNRFGSASLVTDPLNRITTTVRDANNLTTQITRPNGRIEAFTYDAVGNLLTLTEAVGDPLERTSSFEYEPVFNRITKITDPATNVTSFEYDAKGNLTKRINALLDERIFTYDANGFLLTATDENLHTTTLTYDALGRLEDSIDPDLTVSRRAYDTAGDVTGLTEALGLLEERSVLLDYDIMGRLTSLEDAANAISLLRYDAAGNSEELESPTGEIQVLGYDERDRVSSYDDPATGLTVFTYDPDGRLSDNTDARNETYGFTYDDAGQLTVVTDPLLQTQVYAYSANGILDSLTDERGKSTAFALDLLDRRTGRTNPLLETTSIVYDSRDNVVSVTDPKLQLITTDYDALNRATLITTPDNTITLAFDAVGNLTSATDTDSDLSFAYDALDRLMTADTLAGGLQPLVTLTSGYNVRSERTSLGDSLGGAWAYGYDPESRLNALTTPANDNLSLAYDPAGRLTSIGRPNGVDTTASFDLAGRLASLTHGTAALDLLAASYAYDPVGNITQIDEGVGKVFDFVYDPLERLTSAGTAAAPETYAYDALGNRTSSHLSAGHVVDDANRLLEDDQFTYSYDANGNLETKTDRNTLAVTTYTWDAQDQLIRIDFPGVGFATYAYDAVGRRIEKNVDGTITRYVYDGSDIALEFDGTNILQARYSHGNRVDQQLAFERSGATYYLHSDHLGSIRLVTDATGAVVNTYDYDAYGNFTSQAETVAQPYGFTGREYDAESGLHFYRARYYDPNSGRFISEDPIGFASGDANLYRYVSNNPINFVDPDGLFKWTVCFAVGVCYDLDLPIDSSSGPFCPPPPGFDPTDMSIPPLGPTTALSEESDEVPGPGHNNPPDDDSDKGKEHSPDRKALNDLINEATNKGKNPLTDSEADTILDWAKEVGVDGVHDDRGEGHWVGGDHIHVPEYGGKPHIPTTSD